MYYTYVYACVYVRAHISAHARVRICTHTRARKLIEIYMIRITFCCCSDLNCAKSGTNLIVWKAFQRETKHSLSSRLVQLPAVSRR